MSQGIIGKWIIDLPRRPAFYLDRRSTNARRIFSGLDIDIVDDPARANLLWLRRGVEEALPRLRQDQLINHFCQEGAMINKGRLSQNLRAAGDIDFYPESYRLYDEAEKAAFFERLDAGGDEQIWILKPANLSKGIGIRVLNRFDGLRRQFQHGDLTDPVVDPGIEYIAQLYITNPLLLDGKKSELRIYWMIASLEPLRVLMFDEGTVRMTTEKFDLDDLDNPLVHITNTYQQKKFSGNPSEDDLKWTFADLQKYLHEDLGLAGADFVETELKPRIGDCLRRVVEAVSEQLKETHTAARCFGVYGADVIVDATLKPWITEIQKNPGLSHGDPIKVNIVPHMLREAVQIAWACHMDSWRGLPRRFEWIAGAPG